MEAQSMQKVLKQAIRKAGGPSAVARLLGITHGAVLQWQRCPPHWVIPIEKATGIRREKLRPDIYPDD
jgi:DNA-binding transcriptional regulator YdaS (Cro superfamily)